MTATDISKRLKELSPTYCPNNLNGALSRYAQATILCATSNYSVSNLIKFCEGCNINIAIIDMATLDCFRIVGIAELRECIGLLMDRYNITSPLIFRKAGVHYSESKGVNTGFSINTLLAVLDVVKAEIKFYKQYAK